MELAELIHYIAKHPDCSQGELAQAFSVSQRTVRNRVARANEELAGAANIDHERGGGYRLEILDQERLDALTEALHDDPSLMPSTPRERVTYLLNDLLSRNDWVTLDNLSGVLYASRSVLSGDLKQVERKLNEFGLVLAKRPHYGIRVEGTEMDRRLCLASVLLESEPIRADGVNPAAASSSHMPDITYVLGAIAKSVEEASERFQYRVNTVAYDNLLIHIAIALMRIDEGCYIPMEPAHLQNLQGLREYEVAREVARLIAQKVSVTLPEEEIAYIAIHLAGKQTVFDAAPEGADDTGLVISDEVWDVVSAVLERVWEAYHFDFRNDLELRMNLARHIVPLAVRLRYHMELKNPLIEDIRARYLLAWTMAVTAAEVIGDHYEAHLSADETGYIALAFALAIERRKSAPAKKNVLVVCATGVGSARLLEYRIRREFGSFIDRIEECDALHVDSVDFSHIDYVFTTVPLHQALPVPVREVSSFFDLSDVDRVRDLFRAATDAGKLTAAFDRDLFFPHLVCATKDEVLHVLCAHAAKTHGITARLKKLVHAREQASVTSFGNSVAMPHPIAPVSDETFVTVGLLDKPVVWDQAGTTVQAVFLISFAREGGQELDDFFDLLGDLFMSEEAIGRLVHEQTWETLVALLRACEHGDFSEGF